MKNFRTLLRLYLDFDRQLLHLPGFAGFFLAKGVSGLDAFGPAAFPRSFGRRDGERGDDVWADAAWFLEDALLLAVVPDDEAAGGELDADAPAGRSHRQPAAAQNQRD